MPRAFFRLAKIWTFSRLGKFRSFGALIFHIYLKGEWKKMNKNFPADTAITFETFLSDPKVNAELYGYLQSISVGEAGETRVYKTQMMSLSKISTEILGYKSRNTV